MMRVRMMSILLCVLFVAAAGAIAAAPTLDVRILSVPAGTVPQGAQRVAMLRLQFTASCDANVSVQSLSLRHEGRGAVSDLLRVYAISGMRRYSRAVVPRSGEPFDLLLRNFTVPACGTTELIVYADYSSTAIAGSEHRLALDAVQADGSVIRTTGQETEARRTGVSASNTVVSAEFRPLLSTLWYGQNRSLARIALHAEGDRDQQITAITLTNNGSASDKDVQNIFVQTSRGERVSFKTPQMDGRTVRIEFDPPFLLRRSETKLIEVRGDFLTSIRKTLRWTIDEPSDIEAGDVRITR